MSAPTGESLDEEKLKLEAEITELETEYADTVKFNTDMEIENKVKEIRLLKKEKYYTALTEKNAADFCQLELEQGCQQDKFLYELQVKEKLVTQLSLRTERYLAMEKENDDLKLAISKISGQMTKDAFEHANVLHKMNKDMRAVREHMESTLRRELTGLDMSYQQRSFEHFSEANKKSMLKNSQLKDEVALQGVGIANLSTRLHKQELGIDVCMGQIQALHRKAKCLRNRLGVFSRIKSSRAKLILDIHEEQAALEERIRTMNEQLQSSTVFDSLSVMAGDSIDNNDSEQQLIVMWKERLNLLQNLFINMKPVSQLEKDGHYRIDTFTMNAHTTSVMNNAPPVTQPSTAASASSAASVAQSSLASMSTSGAGSPTIRLRRQASVTIPVHRNTQNSSTTGSYQPELLQVHSLKLSAIMDWIESDKALSEALKGLKGKESYLVREPHAKSKDQNMVAWITYEILSIWRRTHEARVKSKQAAHAQIIRDTCDLLESVEQMSNTVADSGAQVYRDYSVEAEALSRDELFLAAVNETTTDDNAIPTSDAIDYMDRSESTISVSCTESGVEIMSELREEEEEEEEDDDDDDDDDDNAGADDKGLAAAGGTGPMAGVIGGDMLNINTEEVRVDTLSNIVVTSGRRRSSGGTNRKTGLQKGRATTTVAQPITTDNDMLQKMSILSMLTNGDDDDSTVASQQSREVERQDDLDSMWDSVYSQSSMSTATASEYSTAQGGGGAEAMAWYRKPRDPMRYPLLIVEPPVLPKGNHDDNHITSFPKSCDVCPPLASQTTNALLIKKMSKMRNSHSESTIQLARTMLAMPSPATVATTFKKPNKKKIDPLSMTLNIVNSASKVPIVHVASAPQDFDIRQEIRRRKAHHN